ncbi:MAG TPA: hypothetical protein PLX20_05945 [Rhodocyclaceae bacterium]|nr:hypothetical protein [Rhodocyclaceae bacterium]HMV54184.1 hypothetical protein [Rhodocyclaceae bacterium]HNA03479.1 hypothetical protein [Rhodocyclaceae bacterium]HNB79545.1 hypothetical protein [Rhodocyclaceae bacterium]HNC61648.1 hypothetical protein [Rhodocyclaceae bacterium]
MKDGLTARRAALIAILALAWVSAPAGAGTWAQPTQLAAMTLTNLPANNASVAVGPNGEAVAVWINEANYAVQYATQSAAGAWSAGKTLYSASVTNGETTTSARVAIGPDGAATVVFGSTTPGKLQYCVAGGRVVRCLGPSTSYAKTATLASGAAAWTRAANLSAKGIAVEATRIGLDAAGNAIATWSQVDTAGAPTVLQSATRPAGAAWSAPQVLHGTGAAIANAVLAVGSNGAAIVAWQEKVDATTVALRSRHAASPGVWDDTIDDVATLAALSSAVRGAVDGLGQAALTWDSSYGIQWARRTARTGWSIPENLVSAPGNLYGWSGPFAAHAPDIALDTAGNVLLSWLETEYATGIWAVQAKTLMTDGREIQSSIEADSLSYPHVAYAPDGTFASLAWVNNFDGIAYAAACMPGAACGPAQPVGPALWGTEVAIGAGNALKASAVVLANTATRYKYKYTGSAYR